MSAHAAEFTLRAARGDDFEAVAGLLEALGRDPVTDATREDCRAVFREQVIDPRAHHTVAVAPGGAIVGFCSLHFRTRLNDPDEEAWIADLHAAETARTDAVLTALLEEAERRAVARGCRRLVAESDDRQAEQHELMRRFRMRDSGRSFRKPLGP